MITGDKRLYRNPSELAEASKKEQIQEKVNIHNNIKFNVQSAISTLDKLENLNALCKKRYCELITQIEKQANENLNNTRSRIYGGFIMYQDGQNTSMGDLKERLLPKSQEVLRVLQSGDTIAIQNYLQPAKYARKNLVNSIDPLPLSSRPVEDKVFSDHSKGEVVDACASILQNDGMIACDFDGTIVPPDIRPPLKMPKEFVEVIQKCHEIGISFAFITGRPTKQIIEAVKNAKAFANAEDEEKFIQNLTIYGRFGTYYREPNTRGEELIRPELEQYIPIRQKIDASIQRRSLQDPILKEYIKEDSNNPGKWSKDSNIVAWENAPGMTISYEGVKKHLEERIRQGEKINIEEELKLVHTSLETVTSSALDEKSYNRAFYKNTSNKERKKNRVCICLNPSTTGISDTKVDPTISLTERLQAKGVIAIGDDLPDIDMQKALRQLIAVKKLIDHYKSDEEIKQRHAMFKETLAQIPDKEIEKRDELNREFYSLLTNSLERQAFVGVQSPAGESTPKEIKEHADFLLNKPAETTRLLQAIVEKLKK